MTRTDPPVPAPLMDCLEPRTLLAVGPSPTIKLIDHFPVAQPDKSVTIVPRSVEVLARTEYRVQLGVDVRAGYTYQLVLRRNNPGPGADFFAGEIAITESSDITGPNIVSADSPGRTNQLLLRAETDATLHVVLTRSSGWRQTFSVKEIQTSVEDKTGVALARGRFGGSIDGPGDTDLYAFDTLPGTQYTFQPLPRSLGDSVLRILAEDGTELGGLNRRLIHLNGKVVDSNPPLAWTAPAAGRYFLEVGGHSAGAYRIRLSATADDQDGTPQNITLPGGAAGVIDYRFDHDSFTFDAVAGHSYSLLSDDPILLYLTDPAGHRVLGKPEFGRFRPNRTFTAQLSGLYTLDVSFGKFPDGVAPIPYRVDISKTSPEMP